VTVVYVFIVLMMILPVAYLFLRNKGLIKQPRAATRQMTAQSIPRRGINPPAREKQISEIMKDLAFLPEELQKNFRKCLNRVHAMIHEESFDDAFLVYDTLCRTAGNSSMLYYNHAGLCYQMKKFDIALKAYSKALELNDNTSSLRNEIYYNIGNTYYMLNQFDKACKYFEKVLETAPDDQQALENLSFTYIRMGETQKGIETFKKFNTEEGNPHAHFVWGMLFEEAGNYLEAEEELKKSVQLQPDCEEALEELGNILMKLNKTQEAIDTYEKLIHINKDNYQAWVGKARAFFSTERWKETIHCYEEAIRIRPDCYRSYYSMAAALDEAGKQKEAIEAYHSAIALNPEFADAYNNLGILLLMQGRREEALEVYEEGIKRNKRHDGLFFNMGMCLYEEGKYAQAVAAYRNALDINPNELEIYYYLGSALTEMRNYNDAIDAYKSALEIKPSDSELYYHIAAIYALLGRNDIAMENLHRAIELNPEVRNEIISNHAFDGMRGKSEFKALVS
jgi:tetratricopeptide (TPR) repeat protein